MFEVVFDSAGEGLVVLDDEFRVLAANPAYTAISGVPTEMIIGHTPRLTDADGHDLEPVIRDALRAHPDGGSRTWRGDAWATRIDDHPFPVALSISSVSDPRSPSVAYVAVFSDVEERIQREQHAERRATHDPLTGLPNRAALDDRLRRLSVAARRHDRRIAALFIDLDGFKLVNDTFGHARGDDLLVEVGQRLRSAVRDGDTVARLGGDEFVVLLAEVDALAEVEAAADRILEALIHPFPVDGATVQLSGSIGIALGPAEEDRPHDLVNLADRAMYEAKTAGRNTYRFSTVTS